MKTFRVAVLAGSISVRSLFGASADSPPPTAQRPEAETIKTRLTAAEASKLADECAVANGRKVVNFYAMREVFKKDDGTVWWGFRYNPKGDGRLPGGTYFSVLVNDQTKETAYQAAK